MSSGATSFGSWRRTDSPGHTIFGCNSFLRHFSFLQNAIYEIEVNLIEKATLSNFKDEFSKPLGCDEF